ncbi:ATP-binding cassette domain-containing protein [Candidatus Latescibacterota bacterium]
MIQINNLSKFYGDFRAVNDLSFTVNDGEILGFLGPNGAGKTTTLKMLTCFMPPSSGTITYNDLDVREHSMQIREKVGYLPENAPLYEYKSVREFLEYMCDLRNIKGTRKKDRISKMIETCGLSHVTGKDIGTLSKGYRQRVGIAQAMIHEPEILILDEPTIGLDPNQIVEIRNLIKKIGEEKTVILSTHILSEVEAACTRVVIISSGEIVADGTPESLKSQMAGSSVLHLEFIGDRRDAEAVFSTMGNARILEMSPGEGAGDTVTLDLSIPGNSDIRREISEKITGKGWTILEMHLHKDNLEDVFRKLTQSNGGVQR